MSYHNPAPFDSLNEIANDVLVQVKSLKEHPEGAEAFAAWMADVDFLDRYGIRRKELSVNEDLPELMVLASDKFSLDEEGRLVVDSTHLDALFVWKDRKWQMI